MKTLSSLLGFMLGIAWFGLFVVFVGDVIFNNGQILLSIPDPWKQLYLVAGLIGSAFGPALIISFGIELNN